MSVSATGLYKLTVYLRPDQYGWLRALAVEEVMHRGGGKPDVSALLRDMVDNVKPEVEAALKKRRKGRK